MLPWAMQRRPSESIPNPDKPELNIDPPAAERLNICGIASLRL